MNKTITSHQNPVIKSAKKLKERKYRKNTSLFYAEGAREISLAIKNGFQIHSFIHCPKYYSQESMKILDLIHSYPSYEVPKEIFDTLVVRKGSDGVFVSFKEHYSQLTTAIVKPSEMILGVVGVEKPGNVGALIRTADSLGVEKIFAIDDDLDFFNPNLIRSSLGAVFSKQIYKVSWLDLVDFCRKNKAPIYSAALSSHSSPLHEVDFSSGGVLLLGAEDTGLPDYITNSSTEVVEIPMFGDVNSLNVSAAGAIIMWEMKKQQIKDKAK